MMFILLMITIKSLMLIVTVHMLKKGIYANIWLLNC